MFFGFVSACPTFAWVDESSSAPSGGQRGKSLWSQRVQEGDQRRSLLGAQFSKTFGRLACFSFVPCDRVFKRQPPQVMHEAGLSAQSPKGRSPYVVGRVLRSNL